MVNGFVECKYCSKVEIGGEEGRESKIEQLKHVVKSLSPKKINERKCSDGQYMISLILKAN